MEIQRVTISNWDGPAFWDRVKESPKEPLIQAQIEFTLSWDEYRELLSKDPNPELA